MSKISYLKYVPLNQVAQYLALGWTMKSNFNKITIPAEAIYAIIMEWEGENPIEPESK